MIFSRALIAGEPLDREFLEELVDHVLLPIVNPQSEGLRCLALSPTQGLDRKLLAIASVVVLGAIMSILDTTVVNVAINTLARDFSTDLATIQWIVTGYTLALATVIPVTGWAADRFGTKRLYMLSIGLFLAGSALAGAAWSAESLIAFRILQGLGGGMLMPAGMTILTRAAGPQRVGRVMAIIGVPMLLGPILGPILGGWLVDDVTPGAGSSSSTCRSASPRSSLALRDPPA